MSGNTELLDDLFKVVGHNPLKPSPEAAEKTWVSLCEAIAGDARFASLDRQAVKRAVDAITGTSEGEIKDIGKYVETAYSMAAKPAPWQATQKVVEAVKAEPIDPIPNKPRAHSGSYSGGGSHSSPAKPVSTIERISGQWTELATEHKIGIGMSCICAAMAAISSVSRFANSVQKDEQGKNHVVGSNLFWGTTSALLAIGMAYLGHAQFKAVAR